LDLHLPIQLVPTTTTSVHWTYEKNEQFEDTKDVFIDRKSTNGSLYNGQKEKNIKTMVDKTIHRKLKIEQH